MMKVAALTLAAVTALAAPALADEIVNTGPGTSASTILNPVLSLAGEISLTQSFTLTSIEGWFDTSSLSASHPGTLTVALYEDGGIIPGTAELFSETFTGTGGGWSGAHGLNWEVGAGEYWVAFEVRPGQTFYGQIARGIEQPLGAEAYFNENLGSWIPYATMDMALRVQGDPIGPVGGEPVPEPTTLALLGVGGLGLAIARRYRKNRTA